MDRCHLCGAASLTFEPARNGVGAQDETAPPNYRSGITRPLGDSNGSLRVGTGRPIRRSFDAVIESDGVP